MTLTKAQRQAVENVAKLDGIVELYKDTSSSGLSETVRYRRTYTRPGYIYPRTESHMLLSVTIDVLPDGNDDPKSLAKYESKWRDALQLFNELRMSNTHHTTNRD